MRTLHSQGMLLLSVSDDFCLREDASSKPVLVAYVRN